MEKTKSDENGNFWNYGTKNSPTKKTPHKKKLLKSFATRAKHIFKYAYFTLKEFIRVSVEVQAVQQSFYKPEKQ